MDTLAAYGAPDIPLWMLCLTEFSCTLGSGSHGHSAVAEEQTQAQEGLVHGRRYMHAK